MISKTIIVVWTLICLGLFLLPFFYVIETQGFTDEYSWLNLYFLLVGGGYLFVAWLVVVIPVALVGLLFKRPPKRGLYDDFKNTK